MNKEKIIPIVKGLLSYIPAISRLRNPSPTGGTINSRYCYSVWMRHLIAAHKNGLQTIPHTIAEFGPGDSIGMGLAALLSGSERYYALEVYKYWDTERNVQIFDELVELFRNRTAVPDTAEFPRVVPVADDYSFPYHILTDEHLQKCLAKERLEKIRNELLNPEINEGMQYIKYFIPWYDKKIAETATVDFIISQSVLQFVDDIDETYAAMNSWLKPGGFMSHVVDFSSHLITKKWNAHWNFSNFEWKLVKGKKILRLNRAPLSEHVALNEKHHFKVLQINAYSKESQLTFKQFSKGYKPLAESDISVHSMFIQSKKH